MSLPQTVYFSISNFLYKLTKPTVQHPPDGHFEEWHQMTRNKGNATSPSGGAQMDKGNLRMTRNKVNNAPHLLNKVNNCTISAVVQNILQGFLFCSLKGSFLKRGF